MLLMIPHSLGFFTGLALLICGNGFFKPNISTIVGSLYPQGSPKRDGGFTIFYMGINLGAAMSPLLCGYIGETLGWWMGIRSSGHWHADRCGHLRGADAHRAGHGASRGGLRGCWPGVLSPGQCAFHRCERVREHRTVDRRRDRCNGALGRGGLPAEAGAPPDRDRLRKRVFGPISAEWAVYLGAALSIVVFVLLVSGFSPLTSDHRPMTIVPESVVKSLKESSSGAAQVLAVVVEESSRPAGLVLVVAGLLAFGYIIVETFRLETVPPPANVRRADPHLLLHALLVVL